MQRMNFCPNCGSPVAHADRFCGSCGIGLNCGAHHRPTEPSTILYSYQYPNQPVRWGQQKEQDPPPPYDKAPAWENHSQCQSGSICVSKGVMPHTESKSVGRTITPMRNEIFRLLADYLDKPMKCNKA